jgi:hypothetical protein
VPPMPFMQDASWRWCRDMVAGCPAYSYPSVMSIRLRHHRTASPVSALQVRLQG